jgi:TRAP-type C4-dicarboxylate transport system permease small subunit
MIYRLFATVKKRMTQMLNAALIVAVAILVFSVCWGVFTRYVLRAQSEWTDELARFLLIWIALLGGAVAFGTKGHLGVDYFVGKLHPEGAKLMAIIGQIIVLIFSASILLTGGSQVVRNTLAMQQTTPALGWKMGHVYLALPIAGIFVILYTLENLIEIIRASPEQLRKMKEESEVAD